MSESGFHLSQRVPQGREWQRQERHSNEMVHSGGPPRAMSGVTGFERRASETI